MASLAGAISTLGLAGVPFSAPVWDSEYTTSPRPFTQTFTTLGLNGTPRLYQPDFTGKAPTDVQSITAADSLLLTLSEDPVDNQGIATADTLRLTLSEVSAVFRFVAVTDALNLSLGETINLGIVGVTDIPRTDTLSLSVSESAAVSVTVAVTDALSLSLTDTSSVAFALQAINVTDALSLALTEASFLNVFTGVLSVETFDDLQLALTDSAVQAVVVPPVPVARMSFELRQRRMRFTRV
jgi:hypothetical protein